MVKLTRDTPAFSHTERKSRTLPKGTEVSPPVFKTTEWQFRLPTGEKFSSYPKPRTTL